MITFQELYPGRFVKWKPDSCLGIVTQRILDENGHSEAEVKFMDGQACLYKEVDEDQMKHMQKYLELLDKDIYNFQKDEPEKAKASNALILDAAKEDARITVEAYKAITIAKKKEEQSDEEFLASIGIPVDVDEESDDDDGDDEGFF